MKADECFLVEKSINISLYIFFCLQFCYKPFKTWRITSVKSKTKQKTRRKKQQKNKETYVQPTKPLKLFCTVK